MLLKETVKLSLRSACFTLCMTTIVSSCFSQSNWTLINADSTGPDCYRLTKAMDHKKGAAWSDKMLNLKKPWDLYFQMDFGNKDNGADGITVVLQKSPLGMAAIGDDGEDLGFASDVNPINPSIDIEFDTYQNAWPTNDIADDHCAIEGNGAISWSLAPPVPLLGAGINVEDDQYHIVQVSWAPPSNTLTVYFDCYLVQTLTYDLLNWIFAGDSMIYYGLTSATGGVNNTHQFCELYNDAGTDTTFCTGSPIAINANSDFTSYSWSPSQGLSCTNCLTPVASPSGTTTYTVTSTIGCLTVVDTVKLTQDCITLPIELINFTASCEKNEVLLKWSTATELNNDHYEVERSPDGREFEFIATIKGAGTSLMYHEYSFADEHPLAGESYYRLKQVDFDGSSTYSSLQNVSCETTFSLFVFPNPADEETRLQLMCDAPAKASLILFKTEGNIVLREQLNLKEGVNDLVLPLSNYSPGIYHLVVMSRMGVLSSMLIIE